MLFDKAIGNIHIPSTLYEQKRCMEAVAVFSGYAIVEQFKIFSHGYTATMARSFGGA